MQNIAWKEGKYEKTKTFKADIGVESVVFLTAGTFYRKYSFSLTGKSVCQQENQR